MKILNNHEAALISADNRWLARFYHAKSIEDIRKRTAAFIRESRSKSYK